MFLVITYLHQLGVRITVLVDDFLVMVSVDEADVTKDLVLKTLLRLGWQINWDKSSLVPKQNIVFIGYVIDTTGEYPTLCVTKSKVRKPKNDIIRALKAQCMSA